MAEAWNNFEKDSFKIDMKTYSEPRQLFIEYTETNGSPAPGPFTTPTQLWNESRVFLKDYLEGIDFYLEKFKTNDVLEGWQALFEMAFDPESQDKGDLPQLRNLALQLARTPPSIFGESFKENDATGRAELVFNPFDGSEESLEHRSQRYDMVLWVAAYYMLGNAWSYLSAEPIVAQPDIDPSQPVLRIGNGRGDTFIITQEAKDAMSVAIDSNANLPTIFFRCQFVMLAVSKILGVNMLEYSMPQTQHELDSFDWSQVVWDNMDTFPKARDPTTLEFEKVRTVHEAVKKEKDALANKHGKHRSLVQSYSTYKQRWKQWREFFAVYRAMNPKMTLQTVQDTAQFELKLCKSLKDIYGTIKQAVKKHLAKIDRAKRKQAALEKLEQSKAAATAAAAEAEAAAAEAAQRQVQLQEERVEIVNSTVFVGTRSQQAERRRVELKRKQDEEVEVQREHAAAVKLAAAKTKERDQLGKEQEVVAADAEDSSQPKKKKSKRHDIDCLKEQDTPRAMAETNTSWKPPTRMKVGGQNVFEEPGAMWVNDRTEKLDHLISLRNGLQQKGLLHPPMTLYAIMEYVGADARQLDFNGRVYTYLIALLLNQSSDFDCVVGCLAELQARELVSAEDMANATELQLQNITKKYNDDPLMGRTLSGLAAKLINEPFVGKVPGSKEELLTLVDETVASLMMTQAFHSTDLVVGLHARKILTALDMYDWEDSGVAVKADIKMTKITTGHVKKSLKTWIPKGIGKDFHYVMESLGIVISANKQGTWGTIKSTINSHFPSKDKKTVTDMVESISQFYKATRSKRGTKRSLDDL